MRALAILVGFIALHRRLPSAPTPSSARSARRTAPTTTATATPRSPRRAAARCCRPRTSRPSSPRCTAELGPEARLMSLDVKWTEANAIAVQGDHSVYVDIDASGRSQSRINDDAASLAARDAAQPHRRRRDRPPGRERRRSRTARRSRRSSSRAPARASGTIDMVRGEPDRLIANLDGSGVRLSGEPNPEPVGAAPGLAAAQGQPREGARRGQEGRAGRDEDRRLRHPPRPRVVHVGPGQPPARARLRLRRAARPSRDISAKTGAPEQGSVTFDQIDTKALDRMAALEAGQGPRQRAVRAAQPAGVRRRQGGPLDVPHERQRPGLRHRRPARAPRDVARKE